MYSRSTILKILPWNIPNVGCHLPMVRHSACIDQEIITLNSLRPLYLEGNSTVYLTYSPRWNLQGQLTL